MHAKPSDGSFIALREEFGSAEVGCQRRDDGMGADVKTEAFANSDSPSIGNEVAVAQAQHRGVRRSWRRIIVERTSARGWVDERQEARGHQHGSKGLSVQRHLFSSSANKGTSARGWVEPCRQARGVSRSCLRRNVVASVPRANPAPVRQTVSLTGLEDGLTAYLFQRARGTGRDLDCGLAGLSPSIEQTVIRDVLFSIRT